jgi:hypothetical protein
MKLGFWGLLTLHVADALCYRLGEFMWIGLRLALPTP